jgi:hypothetical protein
MVEIKRDFAKWGARLYPKPAAPDAKTRAKRPGHHNSLWFRGE